jgi:hypothetical protein
MMPMMDLIHMATALRGPLRDFCRPVCAVLAQPLITVGMLLFLYTGWHVRDEGGLTAGLRVAFIDTRAYRADHEHEREAAMLQTELHYAADTDKIVDEMLANLLGYTQGASRVRLGVVHNGITGVTGIALLRYDITNAVAAPGKTVGPLLLNQPLSDWNDFLPVLLAGRCFLGLTGEQPNPTLRAGLQALGAGTFMACPVIDNKTRVLGALLVTWDVSQLPPTGDAMQALMKHTTEIGTQIAAALSIRGRLSPYAGGSESQ